MTKIFNCEILPSPIDKLSDVLVIRLNEVIIVTNCSLDLLRSELSVTATPESEMLVSPSATSPTSPTSLRTIMETESQGSQK